MEISSHVTKLPTPSEILSKRQDAESNPGTQQTSPTEKDPVTLSPTAQKLSSASSSDNARTSTIENRQQAQQAAQALQQSFQARPDMAVSSQANATSASVRSILG